MRLIIGACEPLAVSILGLAGSGIAATSFGAWAGSSPVSWCITPATKSGVLVTTGSERRFVR